MIHSMRALQIACPHRFVYEQTNSRLKKSAVVVLLLCLLMLLLTACDTGNNSAHHQTVQTDSGNPVTYSTLPQDVLIRIFYGGGKVSTLEMTPEISIYGDGTFITGPGLQPQQGSISSDDLQSLLHTLTSTDNLLQLHHRVFDD